MINRAINTDVGREMYGFAKTLVCAYWDMYGKYTCRYFYLFIYLFIGFDLENVVLASMEMVTELGLVVERTCFRGFRSDETSILIF